MKQPLILVALIGILTGFLPVSAMAQEKSSRLGDSVSRTDRAFHKTLQVGTSVVATVGITQLLKAAVSEVRPDREGNNSFPSRHSSWAFAAAGIASHELYSHSGWWVIGAQAVANGIGFQRVMSRRHYAGDVLAGAAVGLLSVELGYRVGDWLYPGQKRPLPSAENLNQPNLSLSTEAVIPLGQPSDYLHCRTGMRSTLRLAVPIEDAWSVNASVALRSVTLMHQKRCIGVTNGLGLMIGGQWYRSLSDRWAVEAGLSAGVIKNMCSLDEAVRSWSAAMNIGATASWQLTPQLAFAADLGYELESTLAAKHRFDNGSMSKGGAWSSLTVGGRSIVKF